MFNRRSFSILICITMSLFSLANCGRINAQGTEHPHTLNPIISSSPLIKISEVPTPSKTPGLFLTVTFLPTIFPDQEKRMVDLLHSSHCELPCYLGITPGETPWETAEGTLKTIGADYLGKSFESGFQIYDYEIKIGDPMSAQITPDSNTGSGDLGIDQYVRVTVGGNTVQQIYASIGTEKFVTKYREYWSRYLLDEIIQRLGEPDKIFMSIPEWGQGYSIFTIYENQNTVLSFDGIETEHSVCPLWPDKMQPFLSIVVTNKAVLSNLYAPGKAPPTDPVAYMPIKEALGIDENEFYNRIQANHQVCFDIKKTQQ
jgi:hypothetical protein